MVSFWQLNNRMRESEELLPANSSQVTHTVGSDGDTPLLNVGEDEQDEKIRNLLKVGKQLSDDFWENLIKITNNADSLAKLLGVPAAQISEWGTKINRALEKLGSDADQKERKKLVKTGNSPILAQDQDGTATYPSDTRPTP